jgi:hypothetical protein
MNWAIVIVGAEVVFSVGYWFYAAKYKYTRDVVDSTHGVMTVLDGQSPFVEGLEAVGPTKSS